MMRRLQWVWARRERVRLVHEWVKAIYIQVNNFFSTLFHLDLAISVPQQERFDHIGIKLTIAMLVLPPAAPKSH